MKPFYTLVLIIGTAIFLWGIYDLIVPLIKSMTMFIGTDISIFDEWRPGIFYRMEETPYLIRVALLILFGLLISLFGYGKLKELKNNQTRTS